MSPIFACLRHISLRGISRIVSQPYKNQVLIYISEQRQKALALQLLPERPAISREARIRAAKREQGLQSGEDDEYGAGDKTNGPLLSRKGSGEEHDREKADEHAETLLRWGHETPPSSSFRRDNAVRSRFCPVVSRPSEKRREFSERHESPPRAATTCERASPSLHALFVESATPA